MKLPNFKKKEDIPAPFLELYEEVNGEWVPKKDDEAPTVEDLAAVREALRKEREGREKAEKDRKALEKKQEQDKKDADRRGAGLTDDQLKKIRDEVKAELEGEYKPKLDELATAQKDIRTLRLDNAVKALMGKKEVGVRGERHDTLWKLVADDFDLTEDGKPFVKAKPGTPVEKYLGDTVKGLYPEFFEGSKASGGGASGDKTATQVTNTGTPSAADVLANPADAMRRARAEGATQ